MIHNKMNVSMGYIGTRFNIPGVYSGSVYPWGYFETGGGILKLGSVYPRGYIEPRLNIPRYVAPRLIIPGGILEGGVC